MSKKGDGSGGKLLTTVATTGGVFVLRKLLATAWTKITGRNPPTDLADPQLKLPELLIWSVATAIIVESARYAIVRGTARRAVADAGAE
jgi:hypothetical protein